MSLLTRFVPTVSVVALTLLSALPWGLAPEVRFVLPLIPVAVIHFWVMHGNDRISEGTVFLDGLMLDVLTSGPLGFWSLIYLTGYATSLSMARRARLLRLGGWAALMIVVTVLAAVIWAVSSLYAFEIADWRPLAVASLVAAGTYPVVALLMTLLDAGEDERPATAVRSQGVPRT